MASANTQTSGSAISPVKATTAPFRPNQRRPSTTEALPMFGPGRNWQSATTSAKSAGASQRRSSIITLCAQGSTPPKARAPMVVKPQNNSPSDFGGVSGASASDTPVVQAFRQRLAMRQSGELGVLAVGVEQGLALAAQLHVLHAAK